MSEAAAKATRRQLRRSIGETGLGAVIEQGASISSLSRRFSSYDDALAAVSQRDAAFHAMTFWQRLTWLVTGSIHGLS